MKPTIHKSMASMCRPFLRGPRLLLQTLERFEESPLAAVVLPSRGVVGALVYSAPGWEEGPEGPEYGYTPICVVLPAEHYLDLLAKADPRPEGDPCRSETS